MTQTIYRPARRERFTIVTNHIMNDRRLSAAALGVLVYLLSLPDDWSIHSGQLQERFDVGREKMQAVMRDLREAGYARLERIGGGSGQFAGTRWVIEEEPDGEHREPEKPSRGESAERRKNRQSEKPTVGKAGSELLKTKSILKTNSEQNTVPPQPPEGTREGEDLPSDEPQASSPEVTPDAFGRFEAAWHWGQGESVKAARAAFYRLSESDRESAIRGAAAFQGAMVGRQYPPHASTYLSERKWTIAPRPTPERLSSFRGGVGALLAESYFGHEHGREKTIDLEAVRLGADAPAQKTAAERLTDGRYRLHPNSAQLQRWRDHERRTIGQARPGLTRPSEWPPSVSARIDAGEATACDDGGSRTVPMPEKHLGVADRIGSFPFALAEGSR